MKKIFQDLDITRRGVYRSVVLIFLFASWGSTAPHAKAEGVTIRAEPKLVIQGQSYRSGVYRLFDDQMGISSGSRFERINATVMRGGFRFKGDVHDVILRDIDINLEKPKSGKELPAGIEVQGSAHDILIERVRASGFQMTEEFGKYTNGDGFSTEDGVSRVRFVDSEAANNSDGGFDLKGSVSLDNTISTHNGRNYRFWGDVIASKITSIDPAGAHIWISGKKPQTITINKLVVRSSTKAPIFRIEDNGSPVTISVDRCDIQVPRGTKLKWYGNSQDVNWILGQGCSLR